MASTTTNISNVSTKKLALLDLHIPPLSEQRLAVAEIEKQFSRLDQAVANLQRVKINLRRHASSVRKSAVQDASDTGLPAGWAWSTIGELAAVGTGATPSRGNAAYYEGGDIPWVTSSAVNASFVGSAEQFVTPLALAQTNLKLYPPGTLLVAMYGEGKTRGKCTELRISATTNQALAAIQVDAELRDWLKLFLDHNYENTRKIASGGVQPNLNLSHIRAIRFPVPPKAERDRIVAEVDSRLSILRSVEAEVDASLKRAQALRQAVLSKAFTTGHGP
jgi:type I restriction enzyme S subunit